MIPKRLQYTLALHPDVHCVRDGGSEDHFAVGRCLKYRNPIQCPSQLHKGASKPLPHFPTGIAGSITSSHYGIFTHRFGGMPINSTYAYSQRAAATEKQSVTSTSPSCSHAPSPHSSVGPKPSDECSVQVPQALCGTQLIPDNTGKSVAEEKPTTGLLTFSISSPTAPKRIARMPADYHA